MTAAPTPDPAMHAAPRTVTRRPLLILSAVLAVLAVIAAAACGSEPTSALPGPDDREPPPDDPPPPAEEPCPADLVPVSGPLDGHWLGWSGGVSLLLELESRADGTVTGSGRAVSTVFSFDVAGSQDGSRATATLDVVGRTHSLEMDVQQGDGILCGTLDGYVHGGLHLDARPLSLRRLAAGDPALAGRAWDLVTPTPSPDSLSGLVVRGDLWLVPAYTGGLLLSRDAGATWERPVQGIVQDVAVHPEDADRILVARSGELLASDDGGRSWRQRASLGTGGLTLHVTGDGSILAARGGHQWQDPGVFRSDGWDGALELSPYVGWEGESLITWDIVQAPWSGTVYAGTEIGDHPVPYDPPFFVSRDGGATWTDVGNRYWTWHSYDLAVDPAERRVYNLLEGPGLWVTEDDGATWELWSNVTGLALHVDPGRDEVWVGQVISGLLEGGAYLSRDGGRLFEPAGLKGESVSAFARDAEGRLLAAVVGRGIMRLRE